MTKSSDKQIIEDEKKVIQHLIKNSTESADRIAKKCGFSRQKVWRIIKRLEKENTIWGYTAIIDQEKQGYKNYYVLIKKTTLPLNEELVNNISKRKIEGIFSESETFVESSLFVHGHYDWIISINTKDIKEAKKFCELLNDMYKGYIAEIDLLETLVPVRKQGILNPDSNMLKGFL